MWRIIISALLYVLSSSALAITVTFDGIESGFIGDSVYTENGVTITSGGGDLGYYDNEGTIHLADFATSFTASIIITAGSSFSAESVDILSSNSETRLFYELADSSDPTGVTFASGSILANDVLVRGYRGATLVAEDRFSMHEVTTYIFGEDFAAIDLLEIVAEIDVDKAIGELEENYPGYDLLYLDCGDNAPCTHFSVDNLSLDLDHGADPESPVCGMGRWSGKKPWFH